MTNTIDISPNTDHTFISYTLHKAPLSNLIYRDDNIWGIYIIDIKNNFDTDKLIEARHPEKTYLEWRERELSKYADLYKQAYNRYSTLYTYT